MSKRTKMLNKYARFNAEILTPITIEKVKNGDYNSLRTTLLRCVKCGCNHITFPILSFYGYRAEALKCYHCQKKERLVNTFTPVSKVLSTRFNF